MTRRLRLTVAYDGRPFCGWQSQAGKGSVQDALEAAFATLNGGVRIPVHGSGRTDSGVHALAQSAHADVPRTSRLTLPGWLAALNAHLPPEIRVSRCQWAAPEFHARFAARGKRYIYRIWNSPVLPPLEVGRAWLVPRQLDLDRLRTAAALLIGTHDFGGFAANRGVPCPDTVRTIHKIDLKGRPGGLITLTFEGDGFLYKMVRLLTGSLVRVAINRAEPEWLTGLLEPPQPGAPRVKTSFAAPAEGLYLARVFY
ncbi:MAG: tRNA pseudouridine(38-40) synthase TruA [Chthoniobacteraceae bacterium]